MDLGQNRAIYDLETSAFQNQITNTFVEVLPEDQRRAVELHHLQALPSAEVAELLGRSEASVAGLLRRGLKRLREVMREYE